MDYPFFAICKLNQSLNYFFEKSYIAIAL
jgi:hypothetical protein